MCGLAGIVYTEETTFDKKAFEILGILNDERGGDSCGIYIDGLYQKGIGEEANFRDFTQSIQYPEKATVALVHDRATSKDLVTNLEQCQPIVINDEFVLLHNGTITNYKELAKKYLPGVCIKGWSDSQVIANILYNGNQEVLEDYFGSATLVWYDLRTQSVYFWSGYSIFNGEYEDYKCERQLYYVQEENRFMFSSVRAGLYLVSDAEIKSMSTNILFRLHDNCLIKMAEIDRTKIQKVVKNQPCNVSISISGKLRYDNQEHLYYNGDFLAHGVFNIFSNGTTCDKLVKATDLQKMAFWQGKLLLRPEYFGLLKYYHETISDDFIFLNYLFPVLVYCSYEPIYDARLGSYIQYDDQFNLIELKENYAYASFFPAGRNLFPEDLYSKIDYKKAVNMVNIKRQYKKLSLEDLKKEIHKLLING